jgi:hypothetical protein
MELLRIDQRGADHLRGVLDRRAEEHAGRRHVVGEHHMREPRIHDHRNRAEQHHAGDRDADVLLPRAQERRNRDDRRAAADRRPRREQVPDSRRDAKEPPERHRHDQRYRDTGDHDRHCDDADAREQRERQPQADQRDADPQQRLSREIEPGIGPAAEPREIPPQDAEDDREQDRTYVPAGRKRQALRRDCERGSKGESRQDGAQLACFRVNGSTPSTLRDRRRLHS